MKTFITQRLVDMHRRPAIWACTREGFGMQLLTLVEVACAAGLLTEERRGVDHLKIEIFGRDTSKMREEPSEDWCQMAVEIVQGFLNVYAKP